MYFHGLHKLASLALTWTQSFHYHGLRKKIKNWLKIASGQQVQFNTSYKYVTVLLMPRSREEHCTCRKQIKRRVCSCHPKSVMLSSESLYSRSETINHSYHKLFHFPCLLHGITTKVKTKLSLTSKLKHISPISNCFQCFLCLKICFSSGQN